MSSSIKHERAFELLPWLVNGTLGAHERDAVEQHLKTCLTCRRELKDQQRLRAAVRAQPVVQISPQSGFEKLVRELGRTPAIDSADERGPLRTHKFARFGFAAAAGVALVGILVWLVSSNGVSRDAPTFETLATEPAASQPAIDVIFVQSITAAEMQQLLFDIGASIASGPTEIGRYTVRLDDERTSAADVDRLIARLRKDSRVRFAGRALAPEAAP